MPSQHRHGFLKKNFGVGVGGEGGGWREKQPLLPLKAKGKITYNSIGNGGNIRKCV